MSIQYAGGTNVHNTFSGVTKTDLLTNIRSSLLTAGWASVLGAAPSTVTITLASPGVFTSTATAPADGTRVVFSTTGALPTGVTAGTVYFVKSPSGVSFNIAATSGGTAINTSGSQSGTHTANFECMMTTATTPQGYAINCRFRDNGSTCVQFSIETTDGVKVGVNSTTTGGSIRPAVGKTWHIVACKYQFVCWVDSDYNIGNEFILVSCPFVFSFLTPTYIGVLQSAGRSDGVGLNGDGNWRYTLFNSASFAGQCFAQVLYGSNLNDSLTVPNGANGRGIPGIVPSMTTPNVASTAPTFLYRYANGDLITMDPLVGWGLTAQNDEFQIRCQLWDAVVINDSFLGDTLTSFDSHNWIILTSSQTSSTQSVLVLVLP